MLENVDKTVIDNVQTRLRVTSNIELVKLKYILKIYNRNIRTIM